MIRCSLLRILLVNILLTLMVSSALADAQTDSQVAEHRIWRQLLHTGQTAVHAQTKAFYLSANGFNNPLEELQATLQAFANEPESQCRYPARRLFLQRYYPAGMFPAVACTEYQAFIDAFTTDSVSLIYASGYLGNPASMFGHVFLKFNGSGEHNLLDNTFSYGASVPDADNKLAYIMKGITGGYEGHFTNQKYHHHDLTYNESELRNLWEYPLSLDEQKIAFLLAHVWELQSTSMTYYFFKQNCAYQLAKLLELVTGTPLTEENKYWVMPVDLVMMLNKSGHDGKLYTDVQFHGSRQQSLYDHYQQLSARQQQAIKEILALPAEQTPLVLSRLNEDEAREVIDTFYDYVAFQAAREGELSAPLKEKKRLAMVARFNLPVGKVAWRSSSPVAPHNAQFTSLLQTGLIHSQGQSAATFRFRANYYDLLTYNPGRIPFSELSTFDLKLAYSDSQGLSLKAFTLLNVINLNASQTGLPGDDALAWKISAGYRQQGHGCQHCSSAYFDGFVGKAWSPSARHVLYAALSTTVTSSNRMGGNIAAGVEVGGVSNITPSIALSFSAGHQRYLNAPSEYREYVQIDSRWLINQSWDLRAGFSYLGQTEWGLLISYYY